MYPSIADRRDCSSVIWYIQYISDFMIPPQPFCRTIIYAMSHSGHGLFHALILSFCLEYLCWYIDILCRYEKSVLHPVFNKCLIISIKYELVVISFTYNVCKLGKRSYKSKIALRYNFFPVSEILNSVTSVAHFSLGFVALKSLFSLFSAVVSGLNGWYFFFFYE